MRSDKMRKSRKVGKMYDRSEGYGICSNKGPPIRDRRSLPSMGKPPHEWGAQLHVDDIELKGKQVEENWRIVELRKTGMKGKLGEKRGKLGEKKRKAGRKRWKKRKKKREITIELQLKKAIRRG